MCMFAFSGARKEEKQPLASPKCALPAVTRPLVVVVNKCRGAEEESSE